jgi:hypothetical protein
MTALIQFIVLKREGKWVVKSKDLERVFSVIDAAIRFANDSGKEGRPGVVLLQKSKSNSKRFGHTRAWPAVPLLEARRERYRPAADRRDDLTVS